MSHRFRIRLEMPPRVRLQVEESELVLSVPSLGPLRLRPLGATQFAEAAAIEVSAGGFDTEEQATDAAVRARSCLQVGLARIRVGADFGERLPDRGHMSGQFKNEMLRDRGVRVLDEPSGTMVFEDDVPTMLFSAQAQVEVRKDAGALERLATCVVAADSRLPHPSPSRDVAYEFFAASFFVERLDARFVMLMAAVEAILDRKERSGEALAHVQRMITATKDLVLSEDEEPHRASLLGALNDMKMESITQAGRRLARTLGDRTYADEPAEQFFKKCYYLRSQLVHANSPLPPLTEIRRRVPALQQFMCDLFVGDILDVVEPSSR